MDYCVATTKKGAKLIKTEDKSGKEHKNGQIEANGKDRRSSYLHYNSRPSNPKSRTVTIHIRIARPFAYIRLFYKIYVFFS